MGNKMGMWLAIGIMAVLAITLFCTQVSYSNREVALRQQILAQQAASQQAFDAAWKIVQGQAGVASQYKADFKDVFLGMTQARYSGSAKDATLSFIREHNPEFSSNLYEKVAASIEAQRLTFKESQVALIDLDREHKTLRHTFPGSLFLSGRPDVPITLVTSAKTEAVFQSGQDDTDPNPFAGGK